MEKRVALLIVLLLLISSCSNPLSLLENPTKYAGLWKEKWILYDEKLNTGGDFMLVPSDPGEPVVSLEEKADDTAYSGRKYLRFSWNGEPIWWEADPPDNPTSRYEHSFSGVCFIVATSYEYYDLTEPRDLSESGYRKLVLYIRGALDKGYYLKIEAPGGSAIDNITPTSSWKKYEVEIYNLFKIKDFLKIVIYYPSAETSPPGKGGHIDIDMVYYER